MTNPVTTIENTVDLSSANPANARSVNASQNGKSAKRTIKADLTKEYVSSGTLRWYNDLVRALPKLIDEIEEDFGIDIYRRMMLDPQVASSVNTLKSAVTWGGVRLTPPKLAGKLDTDANRNLAQEIAEWCQTIVDSLDTPIEDVLWDLLDAVVEGNKVGELVYELMYGDWPGARIGLTRINVKPRENVAFVVDKFNKVIGILPVDKGAQGSLTTGSSLTSSWQDKLLPREKFIIFTFRPRNGDPRGSSICRVAYFVWWCKQQTIPEWLKYLAQFATQSMIGYTPEGAQPKYTLDLTTGEPVIGADGRPVMTTPEEEMVATLVQVRGGSAASFPAGASVQVIASAGEGTAFVTAFDEMDRWIGKAILHQTLATGEGEHQARSAAEVHQDILGQLTQAIKWAVARVLRRDVITNLVRYNWGEENIPLAPLVNVSEIEQQDFGAAASGVSSLMSSQYIDPTQYDAVDAMLGLPPRDREIMQMLIAAYKASIAAKASPTPPTTLPAQGEQLPQPSDNQPPTEPSQDINTNPPQADNQPPNTTGDNGNG